MLQEMPHASRMAGMVRHNASMKCFNAAISSCEKGAHWEEGLRLLLEVLHRPLTPDMVSYNAVSSSYEKGEHWEYALRLLQGILQRFITPDVVSHDAAPSACEKGKHWE